MLSYEVIEKLKERWLYEAKIRMTAVNDLKGSTYLSEDDRQFALLLQHEADVFVKVTNELAMAVYHEVPKPGQNFNLIPREVR